MAITVIPEAQPASDGLGGQEAQTPMDLRLGLNLAEFRSGIRHIVGSSLIGLTSAAATIGLLWTSWGTGQNEAAFFAGFTAINTYWMIAYCRAACSTLFNLYRNAFRRADEFERQNFVLRKRVMEEVRARHFRGQEGETDGAGGTEFSPSVSRFRRIPLKGEVH